MFRSISTNPVKKEGKLANENTRKMITTQYTLGVPDWKDRWQSNTKDNFAKPVDPPKYHRVERSLGNQITFGSDKVDFLSNTKSNFGPPP